VQDGGGGVLPAVRLGHAAAAAEARMSDVIITRFHANEHAAIAPSGVTTGVAQYAKC
jgi:hypothetical protein